MVKKGKFYILGIHDGHNASVCLMEDERAVFAIQEERLNNIKNFWGFPENGIKAALDFAKISAADVDIVAMASLHSPKPPEGKGILEQYKDEYGLQGKFLFL
ncbi:MAG: hypothetical protein HQL27_09660, partial [Candidatus Omnitrophica bacterium]|nr:hypothetical protein [Candidatus Omnitrophota bacterium]